jgi:hypothetical protein
VTAEDGSTTTYTYDFGASTRTAPSRTYTFTLDAAVRELDTTDPLHAGAPFSTTYRAAGQPASRPAGQPRR